MPIVLHPTPPPRGLRWMQPLLALVGLASLPLSAPARPTDVVPAIERVQGLRERLLAADAAARHATHPMSPAPADPQVAQWQKWNDWGNWAKWGKQ